MKTELIIRQALEFGNLSEETYANITSGSFQYITFTTNGDVPPTLETLYVFKKDGTAFDPTGNFAGFTVDEIANISGFDYEMYIVDGVDFSSLTTDYILTTSPTFKTEHHIDLYEDISIPITFSIADIQDITKKTSARTTTIKIPGSKNNNKTFKNIFYIPATDTFRLNSVVECSILYDSLPILDGVFMLNKVIKLRDNISYEGTAYTAVVGLFEAMGDKLLYGNQDPADDLDFSEYSHTLNGTNILNSLTTLPGSGYTYIPVDKVGHWNRQVINVITNPAEAKIDCGSFAYSDITLCLFIKEIWDKIFEKYGFDYFSHFFDDIIIPGSHHSGDFEFRRLIYPNVSQYTEVIDIKDKSVSFKNPGITTLNIPATTGINQKTIVENLKPTVVSNTGAIYNPSTGQIVIPENGFYDFDILINANMLIDTTYPLSSLNIGYYLDSYYTANFAGKLDIMYNGNILLDDTSSFITSNKVTYDSGLKVLDSNGSYNIPSSDFSISVHIENRKFYAGDIISIRSTINAAAKVQISGLTYVYAYTISGTNIPVDIILNANYAKIDLKRTNRICEGDVVNPTVALGKKMKQSDFILSIIKMFNLYIEPVNPTFMLINPRDYYYSGQTDYSLYNKLDISNPIEIERTSDIVDKKVNLKYKKDKDYFNELYTSNYSTKVLGYGEYLQDSGLINVENKYTIEVSFAPTICGTLNNPLWYFGNDANNCECPKIFNMDANDNTKFTYKEYEPRILYWQGLVDRLTDSNGNYLRGTIKIWNDAYTSLLTLPSGKFPNASMFDKPYGADEFTLDFGKNDYYWNNLNGTQPTYQNLYWMYYRNMIDEYTNPDNKLVTLYVYLTGRDISQVNFSNFYMIDGVRYRINKIENFVPNRPTKVELIKIS